MTSAYKFQAIILAAGTSSRMGRPKQLLKIAGDSMLDHAIATALEAGIERPILVLGSSSEKIQDCLKWADACEIVVNNEYAQGQSSSLKAGVKSLSSSCDAAVFLLCDQPFVRGKLVAEMMNRFRTEKPDILYPVYQNQRGNPVIIRSSLFPRLLAATGDKGARFLFTDSSLKVLAYEVHDQAVVMDIDTPEDYQSILERVRH